MTDTPENPDVSAHEIDEATRRNLTLLEHINVNNVLSILYGAIKELHGNMTEAQKAGTTKKTQYNKGYMTALADINESIKYLVKENIKYAQEAAGVDENSDGFEAHE